MRPQVKGSFRKVRSLQVAAQAATVFVAAFPAASSFNFKFMMMSSGRGDQRACQFRKIFFLIYRNIILIIVDPIRAAI
jgi:hypothetical protein